MIYQFFKYFITNYLKFIHSNSLAKYTARYSPRPNYAMKLLQVFWTQSQPAPLLKSPVILQCCDLDTDSTLRLHISNGGSKSNMASPLRFSFIILRAIYIKKHQAYLARSIAHCATLSFFITWLLHKIYIQSYFELESFS